MIQRSLIAAVILASQLLVFSPDARAEWQPAPGDRLQERAAKAIDRVRKEVDQSERYFEEAYAIAVWPGITRIAAGFGGAYGKGIAIEGDEAIGTVGYWQGSSGIQAGARNFALVIFFRDQDTFDALKRGDIRFTGQAGIDVGTAGISGTPAYSDGVAMFALTNIGLMAEFSAAGVWFRYKPYQR